MRRRTQSLIQSLPPSKLYLNDLERIDRILREGAVEMEITSGAYEFDEPAQLKELGEQLHDLEIQVTRPGLVSFALKEGRIRLYASEDTGELAGKLREVREVIEPRRRRVVSARMWGIASFLGLTISAYLLLAATSRVKSTWPAYVVAGVYMMAIVGFQIASTSARWNGSIVYTVTIDERPGWWKRNRDGLTVGLIVAVVGFLLGFLVKAAI